MRAATILRRSILAFALVFIACGVVVMALTVLAVVLS